jgi:hypothetical protein
MLPDIGYQQRFAAIGNQFEAGMTALDGYIKERGFNETKEEYALEAVGRMGERYSPAQKKKVADQIKRIESPEQFEAMTTAYELQWQEFNANPVGPTPQFGLSYEGWTAAAKPFRDRKAADAYLDMNAKPEISQTPQGNFQLDDKMAEGVEGPRNAVPVMGMESKPDPMASLRAPMVAAVQANPALAPKGFEMETNLRMKELELEREKEKTKQAQLKDLMDARKEQNLTHTNPDTGETRVLGANEPIPDVENTQATGRLPKQATKHISINAGGGSSSRTPKNLAALTKQRGDILRDADLSDEEKAEQLTLLDDLINRARQKEGFGSAEAKPSEQAKTVASEIIAEIPKVGNQDIPSNLRYPEMARLTIGRAHNLGVTMDYDKVVKKLMSGVPLEEIVEAILFKSASMSPNPSGPKQIVPVTRQ